FKVFFESFDAKLPLVTRMLLSVTDFLAKYWSLLAFGILLVVVIVYFYVQTTSGRRRRDSLFLTMPVLGPVIRFSNVERFCRILGSMVNAGVPAPEAMLVAAGTTSNVVFRSALTEVREALIRGEGIAEPIAASGV